MNDTQNHSTDITLIIVSYNVKEYLANLLYSVDRAKSNLSLQIIVVDNDSHDGSLAYLKPRFPHVEYIANRENVGFGRANNQALQLAKGTYTLLINPDVLISENTLITLYRHLENNPDTGACGCKILNPDGSFAPESRRSVPTPVNALWKVLGLTTLFPQNRRFSEYYLGWMDPDEPGSVPVLSGSFMFFRTNLLQKLEGFDERFFMYGEDIDLCYRVANAGYRIDYVPSTSIIHYKGESTKKDNLRYVITFNKALYQFFDKHYSYGYTLFFRMLIYSGIVLKTILSYLATLVKKASRPATDLLILNVLIVVLFIIRYSIPLSEFTGAYQSRFLIVNLLLSVFYLVAGKFYDQYGKNRFSVSAVIKSSFIAFTGVVIVTFFFRDFAFSRLILLAGAIIGPALIAVLRLFEKTRPSNIHRAGSQIIRPRLLLAGVGDITENLIRKIRAEAGWNYDIIGLVSQKTNPERQELEHVPVVGSIHQLPELVKSYRADQVLFTLDSLSHLDILKLMSKIEDRNVVYKVVPESLDYIVGKSHVEYFDDIPVMDVELPYNSAWNRFVKRGVDILISIILILVMLPFYPFFRLKASGKKRKLHIPLGSDPLLKPGLKLWNPLKRHPFLNFFHLIIATLQGRISLVGAPLSDQPINDKIGYKFGMTGLLQINDKRLYRDEEKNRFELYYLQNYTIWKDFEILFKTVLSGRCCYIYADNNDPGNPDMYA
ncbi:MAG: glycosyltransferase [Cyclonatronaceae bacterium]